MRSAPPVGMPLIDTFLHLAIRMTILLLIHLATHTVSLVDTQEGIS